MSPFNRSELNRLVVHHLVAMNAVGPAEAEGLLLKLRQKNIRIMDALATQGLPTDVRLAAVATAAGLPIAPSYLFAAGSFDQLTHAEACILDAMPVTLALGGLGLIYAHAEVALADGAGAPAHVAYLATPERVRTHVARAAPDSLEVNETLVLQAPDPALLARAHRTGSCEDDDLYDDEDTNVGLPDGPGHTLEHTLEGAPMPLVASQEAREVLRRAEREVSWIHLPPLSMDSGAGAPVTDTAVHTLGALSAEDDAQRVLSRLTEAEIPEEGPRLRSRLESDLFSLPSEENDSWDPDA